MEKISQTYTQLTRFHLYNRSVYLPSQDKAPDKSYSNTLLPFYFNKFKWLCGVDLGGFICFDFLFKHYIFLATWLHNPPQGFASHTHCMLPSLGPVGMALFGPWMSNRVWKTGPQILKLNQTMRGWSCSEHLLSTGANGNSKHHQPTNDACGTSPSTRQFRRATLASVNETRPALDICRHQIKHAYLVSLRTGDFGLLNAWRFCMFILNCCCCCMEVLRNHSVGASICPDHNYYFHGVWPSPPSMMGAAKKCGAFPPPRVPQTCATNW